jgi:MFS family permease
VPSNPIGAAMFLATLSAPVRPDKSPGAPMLLPIFLIVLVDILAFTLVIPLLAIYAENLGATPFVATLLVSVFAVCQLISGPLIGRISDRVGRKPMLIISQVGTLLGLW